MTANQHSLQPRPRRVLNLKAVAMCAIVVVAASTGMHRLHSHQVVRTTDYLKQRADESVRHGLPGEAIQALERYLAFGRVDRGARKKLSELLSRHAADKDSLHAAYAMNENMLLDDQDNVQLRLRQTELAVRLNHFSDAGFHLNVLRKTLPNHPRVWHLSGLVAEQEERTTEAIGYYRMAIEHNSVDGDTCTQLAGLLAANGADPGEAERLFDALIERHESADTFRARAEWLLTQDRTNDAVSELWAGLALSPDDVRLNGTLAAALQRNSNADSVHWRNEQSRLINHLRTQVEIHPTATALCLFCAHTQWDAGHRNDAVTTLKAGIAQNPKAIELQEILIDYLVSEGETRQAEAAFRRLPQTDTNHAHWHFLEGRVLMAAQQWSTAANAFEQAMGFSGSNEHVRHRSGIYLAVCRREQGEHGEAIDAWRSTLQASPTSNESHLGLAAAWLESGRIDLAIAEYRQLPDAKGVPELLASLLIRETLRHPPTRRNWRELDTLLDADDSVITDETQRTLLQADVLFAKGCPARALRLLDVAVFEQPNDLLIRAPRRRVLNDGRGTLLQHLKNTLVHHPNSVEAHIAVVRLLSRRGGHESAAKWLRQLVEGSVCSRLSNQQRLELAAQVAETAAADFERTQEPACAAAMLYAAEISWNQLAEVSPDRQAQLIAFAARHHDEHEVLTALRQVPAGTDPILRSQCWLAALEHTHRKEGLRAAAEQVLRQLVAAAPSQMQLRQAYVEYLVQFAGYETALDIERQILLHEPHNVEALSRCAWILAMTGGDHSVALARSESASRLAPQDAGVRIVRALVLARSSDPAEALPVFDAVPDDARTPESRLYEALALLRCGKPNKAQQLVSHIKREQTPVRWRPADRALLNEILPDLKDPPAVSSVDK